MRRIRLGNGAATNSMLLVFVNVITTLIGMIITKLLSVHFSLSEYGTYSQALLITTTGTSISILGLTNATNYFYNKTTEEDKQRRYVTTIFSIQYVVGLLCAIIIVIFRDNIARYFGNPSLSRVLYIVALTPMMSNLIAMYQTLFVSIGEAKKIAVRNFVVSFIKLIGVLLACFVVNNIVIVLVVILMMDIAQVLIFSSMFRRDRFSLNPINTDRHIIKEILQFSIPMAIYVMSNSLCRDIDKYVVSAFSDTETLAVYANASKILPFDMLTTSLITVLIPIITRFINQCEFSEAKKVFTLYLRIGYLLTFILVGGAIAVARHLMLFLYDEKYISGLSVFIVYLLIDMIRFANVTTVLSGAGKSKILMYVSLLTLAANALFNIIAYNIIGILGPAVVTLVLTIISTILLLHFGAKEIKTRIVSLFNFNEISIILAEIVLFGTLSHFISNFLSSHKVPLFFVLAISYGFFMSVLFGLNFKRIIRCYKDLNEYK